MFQSRNRTERSNIMSEELTEEEKQKKLDAAKAKYDALKKKNKKKKSKKTKDDDGAKEDANEVAKADPEEETDLVKDTIEPEQIEVKQESVAGGSEGTKIGSVAEDAVQISGQSPKGVLDADTNKEEEQSELTGNEIDAKDASVEMAERLEVSDFDAETTERDQEPLEEKKHEMEDEQFHGIEAESEHSTVDSIASELQLTQLDDRNSLEDTSADELTKNEIADIKEEMADEQAHEDAVGSLFPDSEKSFLDTLKEQVPDPKSEPSDQDLAKENEALRAEVKALKLLKMDHLDQIETLQAKVQDLEHKLARKIDMPVHQPHLSGYDEDNFTLSPTPSYQATFPQQQQLQFHSNLSYSTSASQEEIKANLDQWKGWGVDMISWRSIGEGLIIKL